MYILKKADTEAAIELLKEAIRLDPKFAAAYAALSDAYCLDVMSGAPESLFDTALENSKKAISLDPTLKTRVEAMRRRVDSQEEQHIP